MRRWFSVEKPALTIAPCVELIDMRVASKRGMIHGSGTLFCLMPDLMLLILLTFTSIETSVRSVARRLATCSSLIFSPAIVEGRKLKATYGRGISLARKIAIVACR